jgi:hypothetical protein
MKQPQQTHGTPETRRSFDDEFKRQAVALMETGRPVRHLARELEVKASMLYEWKRKFGSSESCRGTDKLLGWQRPRFPTVFHSKPCPSWLSHREDWRNRE